MSKKIVAIVLLLCIAAAIYGCNATDAAIIPTPTPGIPIPPEAITTTAIVAATQTETDLPCKDFAIPQVTQPGSKNVPFPNLMAGFSLIDKELKATKWADCAYMNANDYWKSLAGSIADQWQGWVVATDADSVGYMKRYDAISNLDPGIVNATKALLVMDDPYPEAVHPTATPENPNVPYNSRPSAFGQILVLISSNSVKFAIGQEVRFSGAITQPAGTGNYGIQIPNAQVTIVQNKAEQYTTPQDLQGASISLERNGCFGICPSYKVTVLGNSMVEWIGYYYTKVSGFRFDHVDEQLTRELLMDFDNVNFFSMGDHDDDSKVTAMPYAFTSLILPGKNKTVKHYFGDSSAPYTLTQLENNIDQLLNTQQWIGNL